MSTNDQKNGHTPAASGWRVEGDREAARSQLHTAPFMIKHDLATSPLFDPKNLIPIAQEALSRPGDAYFDAGDPTLSDKWGNIPVPDMSIEQVLTRIEHAKAWVILKHTEKDPRYAEVLNQFAQFVWGLAGPEKAKEILNPEMLVIVSSPQRLRGSKEVWICDPADRSVLSEADVEDYYSGNITAGRFKPEFEAKARRFVLNPGDGVHIPSHAAHWVKNGDGISVSLSLNFEFPAWRAKVYKANHVLRKLGMSPAPPGLSPAQDALKQRLPIESLTRVRKALKSVVKSQPSGS
jgi:hypothetical protein